MFWRIVLFLFNLLKGWTGAVFGFAAILYYGPRKMLETWDWYVHRWDEKVLRAVRREPPRPMFKLFGYGHQVFDIADSVNRSCKSVEKSLIRLADQQLVELRDGGWSATS